MSRTKKRKKNKLIFTLIILLGALAAFAFGALYTGGEVVKEANSIDVLGKLQNIQKKGGKFELTQKDMDELSSLYFAKPKSKGDMTLKGVNIEMVNDELLIKAPISYKNLDLVVSSRGKLNYSSGEIVYDAESFKIGMIRIPKNLVMIMASKFENKNIYAQGNLIKINKNLVPFKINDFKIIDNKILGTAEKLDGNMVTEEKSKKQTQNKSVVLKKAGNDLVAAKSQVKTSKEQQVISKMLSTVSKLEDNPTYDTSADKADVKTNYDSLDSASQNRVKIALISNVDPNSIGLLRQIFGI